MTFWSGRLHSCVGLGDFNGDGITDAAVVNVLSNSVSILIGNGDGTFKPASDVPSPSGMSGIAVADFNGDGKPDLAVIANLSSVSGSVSIMLGNGDGTFQAAKSSPLMFVLSAIVTGDFNDDGRIDVAVAGHDSNTMAGKVTVLLGNGDGTFQAPLTYATGQDTVSIATGDFNGDGKPDLVTANYGDATLSLLLGNGDGTFKTATNIASSYPVFVVAADFNHDGKNDVAVASSLPPQILVYLGNGDGTFQSPLSVISGQQPISLAVGDFNGDGKLDLVVCQNAITPQLAMLLGNGDGTFGTAAGFDTGSAPVAVAVADFDSDSKADLLTVNQQSNSVSILHGRGDGTFVQAPVTGPPGTGIVAGDFNGDGKADIAVAGLPGLGLAVMLGNGNGTFQKEVDYAVSSNPSAVLSSDFNGDGIVDLAILTDGGVAVLLGKGDGTFQAATNYAVSNASKMSVPDVAVGNFGVADFNGDGKPDIVVASGGCSGSGLTILLGNGDGTFEAGIVTALTDCPSGIAVGDFNGDGKADVVVTVGTSLKIFIRNGDGTFQPPQTIASGTDFAGAELGAGDFNGDGKLDFAATVGPLIAVYLGNGDGTFALQATYRVGGGSSVMAADVNGDSTLDLVTANGGGNTVSVLIGNGDGTFQPAINFGTAPGTAGTAVADFNSDGKPDVAAVTATGISSSGVNLLLSGSGIVPQLGLGIAAGSSASATITAGSPASYNLTIGGWGFSGTATLSCTGAPTAATCSVPSSTSVSSTSASTVSVSVTTTADSAAMLRPWRTPSPWFWAIVVVGIVFPASRLGGLSTPRRMAMLAAITLLLILPSCGGSSSSQTVHNGTPPGPYTLNVTATSGSLTQSVALKLVVQ